MMRIGTFVIAASVALAACGGGGDGASEAEPTTTVDVAAALETQLLTAEDLATDDPLDAGWEVGDVASGVDIQLPECLLEAPDDAAEVKLVSKTDLKLPSLEEDLARPDDPAASFEEAAAWLDGCTPEFVFGGAPATGTIERLPIEVGGEQSGAWRTSVTIAGVPVSITNIHIQEGDEHLSLVHVDGGVPDSTVLEGLAATALTKMTGGSQASDSSH